MSGESEKPRTEWHYWFCWIRSQGEIYILNSPKHTVAWKLEGIEDGWPVINTDIEYDPEILKL